MGCSSITFSTEDNRHFLARTMDFTMDPGSCLMVIPRRYTYSLSRAGNKALLPYAVLGMGTKAGGQYLLYDGVNENGIMGAVLYYPGAVYTSAATDVMTPINPLNVLLYLLGKCMTLNDVQYLAETMTMIDEPNDITGHAPPLHFIFSDCGGNTLIMEPDQHGMSCYRDTVGVMTNAPSYPWHETNLRNYIGLQQTPDAPTDLYGINLTPFGQGSGTLGLPGDFTGPSRFVRAAYMRSTARKGINEIDGMNQCMQILSTVNIPNGAVTHDNGESDYTRYVCAMCSESHTYYFHTYDCRRIHAVALTVPACNSLEPIAYEWPNSADIRYL